MKPKIKKEIGILDGWFKYDRVIETPHGNIYLEEAHEDFSNAFKEAVEKNIATRGFKNIPYENIF